MEAVFIVVGAAIAVMVAVFVREVRARRRLDRQLRARYKGIGLENAERSRRVDDQLGRGTRLTESRWSPTQTTTPSGSSDSSVPTWHSPPATSPYDDEPARSHGSSHSTSHHSFSGGGGSFDGGGSSGDWASSSDSFSSSSSSDSSSSSCSSD